MDQLIKNISQGIIEYTEDHTNNFYKEPGGKAIGITVIAAIIIMFI